ncbi:MAG: TM2 domain-containing protein [Verrucomicrobiota bacterium]
MERRKIWVSYLLLIFGGFLGIHKFYLNRTGWGVLYLFTGGLFCIGVVWDLFTLPGQVRACNRAMGLEEFVPDRSSAFERWELQRRVSLLEAEERIQKLYRRLENLETIGARSPRGR